MSEQTTRVELQCTRPSHSCARVRNVVSLMENNASRPSNTTKKLLRFIILYRYLLGGCAFVIFSGVMIASLIRLRLPDLSDPSTDFVTIGTDWSAALQQFRALIADTDGVPGGTVADLGWLVAKNEPGKRMVRSAPWDTVNRPNNTGLELCLNDQEWPNLWHAYASHSRIVVSMDKFLGSYHPNATHTGAGTLFTNPRAFPSLCELQGRISRLEIYKQECLFKPKVQNDCCPVLSLPNLVASMLGKSSCEELSFNDTQIIGQLLTDCLPAFRNGTLKRSCWDHYGSDPALLCPLVEPSRCLRSPLIPFILATTLPDRSPHSDSWRTTLFLLPLRQANSLGVFMELEEQVERSGNLIRGLPLPIYIHGSYLHTYNELISELLVQDTFWLGVGLTLLLFLLFIGTRNLWLPLLTVLGIGWSLFIAYAVYTQLLQIPQFPLINLMAIVLAIGLGADDLLVYFQIWNTSKHSTPNSSSGSYSIGTEQICHCDWIRKRPQASEPRSHSSDSDDQTVTAENPMTVSYDRSCVPELIDRLYFTLCHALPSMTLTTVSTILGLLVNLLSSIVAVKRFALFATLVVASNLVFVLLTAPLFFLLCDPFFQRANTCCCTSAFTVGSARSGCGLSSSWFSHLIQRGRWFISTTFVVGFLCSCYFLFVRHCFHLPQTGSASASFLRPHHPFEVFINEQADWFWAERQLHRWHNCIQFHVVWGIVPQDSRSFLSYSNEDQYSTVPWIPDRQLNLTSTSARQWLTWFCDNELRKVPHLLRTDWIEHRPDALAWFDPALLNQHIQVPLWCPLGHFPNSLDNYVFARACSIPNSSCCPHGVSLDTVNSSSNHYSQCLAEYVAHEQHRFPREYGSGFRFLKRSSNESGPNTSEPVALVLTVVTNLSLFTPHAKLIGSLNELSHWFRHAIATVPPTLSQPYLVFPGLVNFEVTANVAEYLPWSILSAILMACMLVLVSSRNFLLCCMALVSLLGCLMMVVVLLATLDQWTLGVVEGLVLSLASGLAIDPCIHLALAVSRLHRSRRCCQVCGSMPVLHQALTMLNPAVTGSTWSTALAGLCMISCQLLCYHQVGVFLFTLMTCSWLVCYVAFASNIACLDNVIKLFRR